MQTLNDYILDTQRKEERFLGRRLATKANVSWILSPNLVYKTKDGREIPCHNKATYDYYKSQEELGRTI